MGCNCGGGTRPAAGSKYEVQVANSGGTRTTTYSSASEARAAAAGSGGTAWRINADGSKTQI